MIYYSSFDVVAFIVIAPFYLFICYYLTWGFSYSFYLVYKEMKEWIVKKKGYVGTARVVDIKMDSYKAKNPKNFRYFITFEFMNKKEKIVRYTTGITYAAYQVAAMVKNGEVSVYILGDTCTLKGRAIGRKYADLYDVVTVLKPFIKDDIKEERERYKLFNSKRFIFLVISCILPVIFTFVYEIGKGVFYITGKMLLSMIISFLLFMIIYSIFSLYIKHKVKKEK